MGHLRHGSEAALGYLSNIAAAHSEPPSDRRGVVDLGTESASSGPRVDRREVDWLAPETAHQAHPRPVATVVRRGSRERIAVPTPAAFVSSPPTYLASPGHREQRAEDGGEGNPDSGPGQRDSGTAPGKHHACCASLRNTRPDWGASLRTFLLTHCTA